MNIHEGNHSSFQQSGAIYVLINQSVCQALLIIYSCLMNREISPSTTDGWHGNEQIVMLDWAQTMR